MGKIRALIFSVAFLFIALENLPNLAVLPASIKPATGLFSSDGFYGHLLGPLIRNASSLLILQILTLLILFLGIIGWQTRFVVPIGAFIFILAGALIRLRIPSPIHNGIECAYLMLMLSFYPCGDGFSLDARLKKTENKISSRYGWARFACWSVIALCYLAAGLTKIYKGGWDWWSPNNLRFNLMRDALTDSGGYNWNFAPWFVQWPDAVFGTLGIVTLGLETVGALSLLFSKRARQFIPVALILFHLGIFVFQKIAFFDLIPLLAVFWIGGTAIHQEIPDNNRIMMIIWPIVAAFLFFGVVVLKEVELYPLSCMDIYAKQKRGNEAAFTKYYSHHRSGRSATTVFHTVVPVWKENRMRLLFRFIERGTLFKYLGQKFNTEVYREDPVVSFEIQERKYILGTPLGTSPHGDIVSRTCYPADPSVTADTIPCPSL